MRRLFGFTFLKFVEPTRNAAAGGALVGALSLMSFKMCHHRLSRVRYASPAIDLVIGFAGITATPVFALEELLCFVPIVFAGAPSTALWGCPLQRFQNQRMRRFCLRLLFLRPLLTPLV